MPTPLSAIPELQPYLGPLSTLGYSTLEELVGAASAAGPELQRFLGVEVAALLASVPFAAAADDPAELALVQNAEYPLGVDIDRVPRMEAAPMMASFVQLP